MKVGIIGASFAREAYLPALRQIEDVEVVAICSARSESATHAARLFDVPHVYTDWRQMMREHSFELVCIATPTAMHAPMTLAALNAGANVLCEKPTAMNEREAHMMLERAEQLGRLNMIGHELRFNAKRRKMREMLASDAIGKVRHSVIHSVGAGWADPASRRKDDWWSLADQGGGRLGANGSHQVDLLRWWLGEITSVSGLVKTIVANRQDKISGEWWSATADDLVHFNAQFASGAFASVLISAVAHHGATSGTTIYGSEGTLSLSGDTEQLLFGKAGSELQEMQVLDPYQDILGLGKGVWNRSVYGELQEFCAAIRERRPLREGATFLDGLRNQRVLDAIKESEKKGSWIALRS